MQCDIITWTAALTAFAAAMAWGMTLTLLTRTDSGNGEQPIFHIKPQGPPTPQRISSSPPRPFLQRRQPQSQQHQRQ